MSLEHELAALRVMWARGGTWPLVGAGASMWPALRPGDVLRFAARRASPAPGQVWLHVDRGGQRLIAHRVVGAAPGPAWILRGDAMPAADPPVADADLLGPLVTICRGGRERPGTSAWEPIYLAALRLVQRHAGGLLWLSRVVAGLTAGKPQG
jgi:hypothetical protein